MNLTLARARTWPLANLPLRAMAHAARAYLRAYNNELFFDFRRNGEGWLVDQVCRLKSGGPLVCIDVGANHGEWTAVVLAARPDARIVACEMIPAFREALHERFSRLGSVTIAEFGLSDAESETTAYQTGDGGQVVTRPGSRKTPVATQVRLRRGDDLVAELGLATVHLVKIDTDGHEMKVLRGLRNTIEQHRPIIQFEYSEFTGLNRFYLRDFYAFFEPLDYSVGRLMPSRIEFGPYNKHDENFITKNFVAAPSSVREVLRRPFASHG